MSDSNVKAPPTDDERLTAIAEGIEGILEQLATLLIVRGYNAGETATVTSQAWIHALCRASGEWAEPKESDG